MAGPNVHRLGLAPTGESGELPPFLSGLVGWEKPPDKRVEMNLLPLPLQCPFQSSAAEKGFPTAIPNVT
jgi:hypothetical protein